jgi:hypothetical protein
MQLERSDRALPLSPRFFATMPHQSLNLALLLLVEQAQDLWGNEAWQRRVGNEHPYKIEALGVGERLREFGAAVAAQNTVSEQEAAVSGDTLPARYWRAVAERLAAFASVREVVADAVRAASAQEPDQAALLVSSSRKKRRALTGEAGVHRTVPPPPPAHAG